MRRKDSACLNAYIDKDLSDRLAEYCRATGRTKTVVVGWAIDKYLAEHADEVRAAAMMKGGRTDGEDAR